MTSPIWHPFTQHALSGPQIHVEGAEGVYLYTKDGRRIIDAISSWWVNIHGHCHPHIVKAVQQQAGRLEQVIFAGFTHDPAERLAEKLLRFTGMRHSHVFFSDSGSTSVEVALKMALGYWRHREGSGGSKKNIIVALEGGYHGDTFGGMAVGGRSQFNALYEDFLFDVQHVPFPAPGSEQACYDALEAVLKSGKVAAFIVEPLVAGAGGMLMYEPAALKTIYDLCSTYGALFIADEVMTGFGRTGTKFACAQAEIAPDILCLSKGLTGGFLAMGATLCVQKIYDAFYQKDRSKMFFHSSSYMGNALACAAAVASLEIWENEAVMERIVAIAGSHEKAAARFARHKGVSAVRHRGTILAMDVKGDSSGYLSALGPRLYDFFLERNVLLRPLGNTVYIMPPYCITSEELERIYDVIGLALDYIRDGGEQRAA